MPAKGHVILHTMMMKTVELLKIVLNARRTLSCERQLLHHVHTVLFPHNLQQISVLNKP